MHGKLSKTLEAVTHEIKRVGSPGDRGHREAIGLHRLAHRRLPNIELHGFIFLPGGHEALVQHTARHSRSLAREHITT